MPSGDCIAADALSRLRDREEHLRSTLDAVLTNSECR
jgi:hypothetical protein